MNSDYFQNKIIGTNNLLSGALNKKTVQFFAPFPTNHLKKPFS
jgi:hypothetical protein